MPEMPPARHAANPKYALTSAPGVRFSIRVPPVPPAIARSDDVRFSIAHVAAVGAQLPLT